MAGRNPYIATQKRPYDFNQSAVGKIRYPSGAGPNTGKFLDKTGYIKRSQKQRTKQYAALRKMQAGLTGAYFSPEWLRPKGPKY